MKLFRTVLLMLITAAAHAAFAGEIKPYSKAEFDRLTAQGKPVLIDVYATWCPTCRAQKPTIDSLMAKPEYKDVTTLVVDYDNDTATLKAYHVRMQSTLIVFKGKQEQGRSVGDTDPASIESLVKKAVK
jgi:thiol-disulfide isomerase/thioredoxin